jgi:hypothetical protein
LNGGRTRGKRDFDEAIKILESREEEGGEGNGLCGLDADEKFLM